MLLTNPALFHYSVLGRVEYFLFCVVVCMDVLFLLSAGEAAALCAFPQSRGLCTGTVHSCRGERGMACVPSIPSPMIRVKIRDGIRINS